MTELPVDENTPRILIVEDEPKLGQLLIDYLQAAGYAPALINHGDKVLPYVRQSPPHLILLDLMLPGTDGLTLCREIRRMGEDHVALGSDFDGITLPDELGDVAGLPRLINTLRASGYDQLVLDKLLWRNWLRVLKNVWQQ